ncbi:hypothetical protein HK097_003949 [Rhizophlyctis rosea]|uniref:Voltage-gated hydrogen channel 1 n=1 Tax=Rhizophlyctis rosea TaxID=64517 RepID=A0AAD5SGC4_9FUNG|nr:hypothetical protein HK097_003949 [Rhizophlyctis rosea]
MSDDSTTPFLQQSQQDLEANDDTTQQLSPSTEYAIEESVEEIRPPKEWRIDHHRRPEGHWRKELGQFLDQKRFHYLVLFLVVLDLMVVMAEIIITFFEQNSCESNHFEEEWWHNTLAHISTAILCLFNIEIALHLIAFGPRYFTHSLLHLFDAIVVITSLALDLALRGKEQEVAGLLIVLRSWRLVRVVDGVAMTLEDQYRGKLRRLKEENKRLREELEKLKTA